MRRSSIGVIGSIVLLLIVVIIVGSGIVVRQSQPKVVSVSFLDVGQGDSIFIETPDGHQIVIDGGVDARALAELGKIVSPGDHTIDVVVATHPDADHIAGLIPIVRRYDVTTFIAPDYDSDTAVYRELMQTVHDTVPNITNGFIGDRIDTGDGVTIDFLAPYNLDTQESNDVSIVAKLAYGNFSVLLTGDASIMIEQQLVHWYGDQLHSDILKAGHHGSRTSSIASFVRAVSPEFGIISAGKNNRYGHPHQQVLNILEKANVEILATYDQGTITFQSDGLNVWKE